MTYMFNWLCCINWLRQNMLDHLRSYSAIPNSELTKRPSFCSPALAGEAVSSSCHAHDSTKVVAVFIVIEPRNG